MILHGFLGKYCNHSEATSLKDDSATGGDREAGGRFSRMSWRVLFWMTLVGLGPLVIMAAQGYHCAREAVSGARRGPAYLGGGIAAAADRTMAGRKNSRAGAGWA